MNTCISALLSKKVLPLLDAHMKDMSNRTILLAVALVVIVAYSEASAQDTQPPPAETLTLDQAIALALRDNHSVKIAQLAVARADEDISAAKTSRLPSLHAYTLVSGNLARNELTAPNPAANLFPGLGPFFSLNVERRLTAIYAASVIEPLSQQYRIGLHIKLEGLSRDVALAKLRQQQNETIEELKAYLAKLEARFFEESRH